MASPYSSHDESSCDDNVGATPQDDNVGATPQYENRNPSDEPQLEFEAKDETSQKKEEPTDKIDERVQLLSIYCLDIERIPDFQQGDSCEILIQKLVATYNNREEIEERNKKKKTDLESNIKEEKDTDLEINIKEERDTDLESNKKKKTTDYIILKQEKPLFENELFNLIVYQRIEDRPSKLTKWLQRSCRDAKSGQTTHYILFFHRETSSGKEIFALTTYRGWEVVIGYSNFDFPYKIIRRLCDPEHIKHTSRDLLGHVLSHTALMRDPSMVSDTDAIFKVFKNIKLNFRKDSSIYKLDCFPAKGRKPLGKDPSGSNKSHPSNNNENAQNENPNTSKNSRTQNPEPRPRKTGVSLEMGVGKIKIGSQLKPEDYLKILDHFSTIISGNETYCYSGEEKIETDKPNFRYLDFLQKADRRVQELDKELSQSVHDAVKRTRTFIVRKFCSKIEKQDLSIDSINKTFDEFCNSGIIKIDPSQKTVILDKIIILIRGRDKKPLTEDARRKVGQAIYGNDEGISYLKTPMTFCYKRIFDYYNGENYKFHYGRRTKGGVDCENPFSADSMIELLGEYIPVEKIEQESAFIEELQKVKVSFELNRIEKKDNFMKFLEGEIRILDGDTFKSYWKFCNFWYRTHANFLELVRYEFANMLKNAIITDEILPEKWPVGKAREDEKARVIEQHVSSCNSNKKCTIEKPCKDRLYSVEGEYNNKYLNKVNYIFGDKITINLIELFDVCYYDSDSIYLIQVKKGFDQHTRDACSQILNSAEMIGGMRSETKETILEKFYEKAREQLKRFTLSEFCKLFVDRKIVFVYAFADSIESYRPLSEEIKINTPITIGDIEDMLKDIHPELKDKAEVVFNYLKSNHYLTKECLFSDEFYSTTMDKFTEKCDIFEVQTSKDLYRALTKRCSAIKSTIVKLDLLRLNRELKNLNFDFKIYQILRTEEPVCSSVRASTEGGTGGKSRKRKRKESTNKKNEKKSRKRKRKESTNKKNEKKSRKRKRKESTNKKNGKKKN